MKSPNSEFSENVHRDGEFFKLTEFYGIGTKCISLPKKEFVNKFMTCLVPECSYLVRAILMWDSKAGRFRLQTRREAAVSLSVLQDPTLHLCVLQGCRWDFPNLKKKKCKKDTRISKWYETILSRQMRAGSHLGPMRKRQKPLRKFCRSHMGCKREPAHRLVPQGQTHFSLYEINRAFPSCLLPLFQNESWCVTTYKWKCVWFA